MGTTQLPGLGPVFNLYTSNELEVLVETLVGNCRAMRRHFEEDVFTDTHIIVPNWNLETFLRFQFAQQMGVAAGLSFHRLERFLARSIPREGRFAQVRVLDTEQIHVLIVEALLDRAFVQRPDMRPVWRYLYDSDNDLDTVELRCFQLAKQLARLFREYDYSRPNLVRCWQSGTAFETGRLASVERWQRSIWMETLGPEGRTARVGKTSGARWIRLAELFNVVPPAELVFPHHLHVFGLSYVARVFEKALSELGKHCELFVYCLNPCSQFWEDVQTGQADEEHLFSSASAEPDGENNTAPVAVDTGFWAETQDTPALRLWGRPGRDHMRMLNRLSDYGATGLFRDPIQDGCTLLRQLQQDILDRAPRRSMTNGDALSLPSKDGSLQIFACPSIKREVEAIADEIWALVGSTDSPEQSTSSIQFNQIAVVVNHRLGPEYHAQIKAVFEAAHHIPHSVIDTATGASSAPIEAITQLLSLPFGRFRRNQLLRLLTHPCVLARFSSVDRDTWIEWTSQLCIIDGADHNDHDDTYITADRFNWDQGLRRLVLGAFMSSNDSAEQLFEFGDELYVPEEVGWGELDSVSGFIATTRSLIAQARTFRERRMSLSTWGSRLSNWVQKHIGGTSKAESVEIIACCRALGALSDLDLTGDAVSYRVAHEFAMAALEKIENRPSQYLVGGVVVSSFLPMRPLPFKVVFVTGLSEGHFPNTEPQNPFDLRSTRWQEGDVSPRDQDKYMFLETLISTRERLYISYVSRDQRTGDPIEPSSVVRQLEHIIEKGYLGEAAATLTTHHPLRRYDVSTFPQLSASHAQSDNIPQTPPPVQIQVFREAQAAGLRRSLERYCVDNSIVWPTLDELKNRVDPRLWQHIGQLVGEYTAVKPTTHTDSGEASEEEPTATISLPIGDVSGFLENPFQTSARINAGLRQQREEDVFSVEHEPFESSPLNRTILLQNVFAECLKDPASDVEDIYDRFRRRFEQRGLVPTGVFERLERSRHLATLRTWEDNLARLGVSRKDELKWYQFGRGNGHRAADVLCDSLMIWATRVDENGQKQPCRVELYGDVGPSDLSRNTTVLSTLISDARRSSTKNQLSGLIGAVVLIAAGWAKEKIPHQVLVNPPTRLTKSQEKWRVCLSPMTQTEAVSYLELMVSELLTGVHDYHLPGDCVLQHLRTRGESSLRELLERSNEAQWDVRHTGSIRPPEGLDPPSDAEDIALRRFGPLMGIQKER